MSRFGGGVSAGSLVAGPEGGGRKGQEFGVRRGRTSLATYYSVCNLLLGLPPSLPPPKASLITFFFKCKEILLARGFAFGMQLPQSVSALAGREGWGLNLAGGASCCRRRRLLSDSGKRVGDGRGAGEGGFCFATSPGASKRASARTAAADGAAQTMRGWGDLPARESPPRAHSTYALTPLLCPPLPKPPERACLPSGPESGHCAAAPFPCHPVAPLLV